MAYREKLAAVYFIAMALPYSVYFTLVATRPPEPRLIDMLWLFGGAAIVHAVLAGLGTLVVRIQSGAEGRAQPDERDRAINRRGASIAYLVLMTGAVIAGVMMPFSAPPAKIVNAALFAIVIAELVNNGVVLMSYRRGWHG
ncbi:hypothetical protein [Sphingomonas soli]|uniref:hypothetical protein n=1 Tax=Sphingomonas soli TaxID=266127 RepID=UPI00082B9C56|nr:hypothetical protein [Sphingomonas soli]